MNSYTRVLSTTLLVAIVLAPSHLAEAATFNVDRISDEATATGCIDATPNDRSLRGAILAANGLSEASTINLPAGTFVLSRPSTCTYRVGTSVPGIFTSAQIPLCVSAHISIRGAGAAATIIDGDQRGRVLFISAGAVADIRGVSVANGNGGPTFFSSQGGGGIQNHGTLTLVDTVVRGNTLPAGAFRGAGIENFGTLTLRGSKVIDNVSLAGSGGGGGIHNDGFFSDSVLVVSESTIDANTASNGGGILNGATATIIDSTISGNTANTGLGGGIANLHAGGPFTARLAVVNATISGNTCGSLGGGIYNGGLTAADLRDVTVTDNTANTGRFSRGGGGINNQASGSQFTLQNTIVAGNRDLGSVPGPDCFAEAGNGQPVTSGGHNLIEDIAHCTILGDPTGNLSGVDPQLGPLFDNGGLPGLTPCSTAARPSTQGIQARRGAAAPPAPPPMRVAAAASRTVTATAPGGATSARSS